MPVSSRLPMEFIAIVGVLVVTVAIIEVPRSNMLSPERTGRSTDSRQFEPISVPPPKAGNTDERQIARLEASIDWNSRRLDRCRAALAAAELRLLHSCAQMAPMQHTLLNTLKMPQDTLPEIRARQMALQSGRAAVEHGTRAVDRSRGRVKDLSRSASSRRAKIDKMQDLLALMLVSADPALSHAN